jgi:hypothetical protein
MVGYWTEAAAAVIEPSFFSVEVGGLQIPLEKNISRFVFTFVQ